MGRVSSMLVVGAVLVVAGALYAKYLGRKPEPMPKVVSSAERLPVCPWRHPERDLQVLFPSATTNVMETPLVSGMMAQLQRKLGRPLDTDENPLRVYRVHDEKDLLGSILVRRVKGENGGIEIVTAVGRTGAVSGVLVQSHREPAVVAQAITNQAWLAAFRGVTADSPLRVGIELPSVTPGAEVSARAIAEGVRSHLLVLRAAELSLEAQGRGAHTNH